MLTKRIIPCLDVTEGRVVKGINFVDLVDVGDSVEMVEFYNQQGADELVFLDITATSDNRNITLELVRKVANAVFIPFTVGGGIRTIDDMRQLLRAGADKISINSAAVKNPELIAAGAELFGRQCIVVAIDVKWEGDYWQVYTAGGRNPTGLDVKEWAITAEEQGAGELLITSMDRDGTKDGYDLDLYATIADLVNIPIIASGGAGNSADIVQIFQNDIVDAALAASIFHFGEVKIGELKENLQKNGIEVRL